MANTLAGTQLTRRYHQEQVAIRSAAVGDLVKLWPLWDFESLDESWEALVTGIVAVIERYHSLSAQRSAVYYSAFRMAEGAVGQLRPVIAEFDREKAVAGLTLLGPIMTKKGIARGQRDPQAVALVRVSGEVTRQVLMGGRETIISTSKVDPEVRGVYRKTAGTCAFCAQLAGAIEKGGFQAHNNCACVAEPAFNKHRGFTDAGVPIVDSDDLDLFASFFQDVLDEQGFPTVPLSVSTETGDQALGLIHRKLGYDALPKVVSQADFDALPGNIAFRGVTDHEFIDALMTGDYYPGKGWFGNGTYSATGTSAGHAARTAINYAGPKNDLGQFPMVQFKIAEDAKTITVTALQEVQQQANNLMKEIVDSKTLNPATVVQWESGVLQTIDNLGRLASALGYDAIIVESAEGFAESAVDYLIVQNRATMTILDTKVSEGTILGFLNP